MQELYLPLYRMGNPLEKKDLTNPQIVEIQSEKIEKSKNSDIFENFILILIKIIVKIMRFLPSVV